MGIHWLFIHCDDPRHLGETLLAVLTRIRQIGPEGELFSMWLSGAHKADKERFAIPPNAMEVQELMGEETLRSTNAFHEVNHGPETPSTEVNTRDRLRIECPSCRSVNVTLVINTRSSIGGADVDCPILDRLADAGFEKINLSVLAHAVSYGVS